MLEIGQFFKKGNKEYGILDYIEIEGQGYYYFSVEENGKLDYKFYTLKSSDAVNGYDFEPVNDEELHTQLFAIEVQRIKESI